MWPSDPHLVLHLHLLCKRPPLFSLQMIIPTPHKSVRHLFLTLCLLPLTQQSPLLAANSTGSLPRNLAATLQDIEAKRQLALQQKGNWCAPERHMTQTNSSNTNGLENRKTKHLLHKILCFFPGIILIQACKCSSTTF